MKTIRFIAPLIAVAALSACGTIDRSHMSADHYSSGLALRTSAITMEIEIVAVRNVRINPGTAERNQNKAMAAGAAGGGFIGLLAGTKAKSTTSKMLAGLGGTLAGAGVGMALGGKDELVDAQEVVFRALRRNRPDLPDTLVTVVQADSHFKEGDLALATMIGNEIRLSPLAHEIRARK